VINADQGGYGGPRLECGPGPEARFLGYREKEVVTVVGPGENPGAPITIVLRASRDGFPKMRGWILWDPLEPEFGG